MATVCIAAAFSLSLMLDLGWKILLIQAVVLSCVMFLFGRARQNRANSV